MTTRFSRSVLLLLTVVRMTVATEESCTVDARGETVCHDTDVDYANDQCELYMAPSTIPGAGLGIFSAVDKQPSDSVGRGDICIPVIDMYWHNGGYDNFFNPFSDYFWTGQVMGMSGESDSDDLEALCPGLDCAVNCNLALINTQKSSPIYDEAKLHRSRDPGVGAYTPYHNGTTHVSRHIPAGGELFKFYGDNWFETRERIFGQIPLSDDYPAAEELLEQLGSEVPNEFQAEVYAMMLDINARPWDSRTLNALPRTFPEAQLAMNAGELAVLHQPNATRSVEWLREHGRCIDHIVSQYSTIPQAARGAFATRNLQAGQVITTSPLHHVPDKKFMNLYNLTEIEQEDGSIVYHRVLDEVVGQQVLLNYCYGHSETTMLLCPYGAGINYINHNQTLANVAIRWAQNFPLAHRDESLRKKTPQDLEYDYQPQLAFDYVALRDIAQGEELFLDYGDDFEEAWWDHVENFEFGSAQYTSGRAWNVLFADLPVRTEEEQERDPYPEHLEIRCHFRLQGREFPSRLVWSIKDYGFPCRVLDRFEEDDETYYTVELEIDREDDDGGREDDHEVFWLRKTDVPRSGIQFFDKPFHTDLHLPNAFRHPIGIPDHMMPPQWRNVAHDEEDDDEEEATSDGFRVPSPPGSA